MFEFSLDNGKKQLVTGIKCLIISIVILIVLGIILGICAGVSAGAGEGGNSGAATAGLVFTILLGTFAGIFGLLSLIKIIFGAIVYHAERTSSRNIPDIKKDVA